MGWGAFGSAVGERWGSEEEAKGWRDAEYLMQQLQKQAVVTRGYADPYGSREGDYRGVQADKLQGILTGEQSFETDPNYKFVMEEAMRATERQGGAKGYGSSGAQSGNVAAALQDRASGIASQEYDKIISRLMDLSGAGSQNAVAGANIYGSMTQAGLTGQAEASIGKHTALGNVDRAIHTAIGTGVDAGMGSAGMSDIRLKTDLNLVGMDGVLHRYTWTWNQKATDLFGLEGTDEGYIAQEVMGYLPEAVVVMGEYLGLDYDYINRRMNELEAA